jgi:hypothetical protein
LVWNVNIFTYSQDSWPIDDKYAEHGKSDRELEPLKEQGYLENTNDNPTIDL